MDYFKGTITPQTGKLDSLLGHQPLVIGDLILAETLQGFREDRDFELAQAALAKFAQVEMLNLRLARRSAQNYRALRKNGITVRKTIDCLIATFCIAENHTLLHRDNDFDGFEEHLGLKVAHPV